MPVLAVALLLGLVLHGCGGSGSDDATSDPAPSRPPAATPAGSPAQEASGEAPTTPDPGSRVRRRLPDAPDATGSTYRLPTMPAEARERTAAGRDAFVRHVIDLWAHALATNDATALRALAPQRRCDGCAALTRELEGRRTEGWYVALHGVEVRAVSGPRRVASGQPVTVVATVDIPATFSLNDDGTYRTSNPSHTGASFEVDVAWLRGGFRLLGYALSD